GFLRENVSGFPIRGIQVSLDLGNGLFREPTHVAVPGESPIEPAGKQGTCEGGGGERPNAPRVALMRGGSEASLGTLVVLAPKRNARCVWRVGRRAILRIRLGSGRAGAACR